MGTWAEGPFDNDGAADWGNDLDDARPDDRAGMIRAALMLGEGYLDADVGQIAVAAAALVAAVHQGGLPTSAYWPDFLTGGEDLALPDDARALALVALDRVTGQDSELREGWIEADALDGWVSQIAVMRASLQG